MSSLLGLLAVAREEGSGWSSSVASGAGLRKEREGCGARCRDCGCC